MISSVKVSLVKVTGIDNGSLHTLDVHDPSMLAEIWTSRPPGLFFSGEMSSLR